MTTFNKTEKQTIGQKGEDLACTYLKENSYKILFRNYRRPWGEIDIVAKDKDGDIVIVEVKTISKIRSIRQLDSAISGNCRIYEEDYSLDPEDNMSQSKINKTRKIALSFANENEELINEKIGWRIDLITISLNESDKDPEIRHYKNV